MKTVIAHYDRAIESPGANDNSSSVISLMNFAIRLNKMQGVHNVRIFFTDGEELEDISEKPDNAQLDEGESDTESPLLGKMGSFGLAALFKKLGIKNDDVYVFDCTGRGTIPVLAKTVLPVKTPPAFAAQFFELEKRAKTIISSVSEHFFTLPVPYSDNAGFIVCRIPAVLITMLPEDEVSKYANNLMQYNELKDFVTRHKIDFLEQQNEDQRILKEFEIRSMIPATWKLFHTDKDSVESLTSESFAITGRILDAIAASKAMA